MPPSPPPTPKSLVRRLPAAGAALWVVLAVVFAIRSSATTDEIQYLPAGLSLLEYHDFRMTPEHPPLMRLICALPVYCFDRPDMSEHVLEAAGVSGDRSPWYLGRAGAYGCYLLLLADDGSLVTRLFIGRLPVIVLGLLGGWLAFLWGRELGRSRRAGWLAAFFLLSYPEYLGHAALMTLDVPMTVACAAISWAAWTWWKRPTLARASLVVVLAAVGSLVKLPVVVFTIFVILVLAVLSVASRKRIGFLRVPALALVIVTAGIFAAWAGAGFRFSYLAPGADTAIRHAQVPPLPEDTRPWLARPLNFLWRHRLLPETTLCTLANYQKFEHREYYFLGGIAPDGWYSYFFVTFLLKTTPALLAGSGLLLFLGAWGTSRGSPSFTRPWRLQRAAILWIPFLLLLAATIATRVNQGHRYILFLYFPIAAALGAAIHRWFRSGGAARLVAAGIVAAQLLSLALAYPNFTTYFNFLTGTPYKASAYLGDSNTDWGQDLYRLSDYLRDHGIGEINLATYGLNLPDTYGITQYRWIEAAGAPPPFVAPRHRDLPFDPRLPTALSVNALPQMRRLDPRLFARDPDVFLNSFVIYMPPRQIQP